MDFWANYKQNIKMSFSKKKNIEYLFNSMRNQINLSDNIIITKNIQKQADFGMIIRFFERFLIKGANSIDAHESPIKSKSSERSFSPFFKFNTRNTNSRSRDEFNAGAKSGSMKSSTGMRPACLSFRFRPRRYNSSIYALILAQK